MVPSRRPFLVRRPRRMLVPLVSNDHGRGSMMEGTGSQDLGSDSEPSGAPGVEGTWTGGEAGSGSALAPAGMVETHASILFFVGERVYKLRKPVQFGFLDFRQRAIRQADCQRELELNRRLAPDVYVGVADLLMGGEPIDHLVVMRRMPEERRLAALALEGGDLGPCLHRVAERLVTFHGMAERSSAISASATDEAIRSIWEDNFAETQPFVGTILDDVVEAEIRQLAFRWIEGRKPLLDARIALGCVRDGHGDLQTEDIFCLDDGVRILDCLQFSDRLRHGDVCADVSFLVMDLERLGHAEAAVRFLHDYEELGGDRFPDTLVNHYCASRAYVRAKVSCLRSVQGAGAAAIEAARFQSLALDHLRKARVRMVLVGGLPGSGKTTLATGVAAARGWTVLRSDQIRQDLAATSGHPGAPGRLEDRYRPAVTAAVYEELIRRAERALGLGDSVVLDASWIDASWREVARSVAERTSSDLIELCCDTSFEVAEARITRRNAEHADISEATPQVRRAMSRVIDPWPSADVIDTSAMAPDEMVQRALDGVLR